MNTFVIGLLTGFVLFGIFAAVVLFYKMSQEISMIHRIIQIIGLKINKIEKVTQTTMAAAENFVDALQSSAEQMQRHQMNGDDSEDDFQDLRSSFEEDSSLTIFVRNSRYWSSETRRNATTPTCSFTRKYS